MRFRRRRITSLLLRLRGATTWPNARRTARAGEEALPRILEAFGQLPEAELWRWIASTLVRADAEGLGERVEEVAARRGIHVSAADEEGGKPCDPAVPLLAWIEGSRSGDARTLALELLITSRGFAADRGEEHPFPSAAEMAGVDFKAMLREAFAAAGITTDEQEPNEGEEN